MTKTGAKPPPGVLKFVVKASEVFAAGEVAGRRVDTEAQAMGVEPVAEALHGRELLVHGYGAVGIALRSFPCIVNVDIVVSVVCKTLVDDGLC